MGEVILGIAIFSALAATILWVRREEKNQFNGGFCTCGRKWRRYDVDSQGGRGYTCDPCNKGVWVSYWGIDNDFVN